MVLWLGRTWRAKVILHGSKSFLVVRSSVDGRMLGLRMTM
jgi:hypothetical protein